MPKSGPSNSNSDDSVNDLLSPRECEILDLLSRGHLLKETAEALGVEVTTIRTHTARIYRKLQVKSRAQAVAKYLGVPE